MGRGEGALLKKAFPSQTCRRGLASPPSPSGVFRLVGRLRGRSSVGWGWGRVRQIFCGETRLIHKGCEPSNGIAGFTG